MTSVSKIGASGLSTANGDVTATQYVNGATLDTDKQTLRAKIDALIDALAVSIRDDNLLVDSAVRLRSLDPEVIALLGSGAGNTGIVWQPKAQVACASTANLTLSGEQTIDGIVTSASRVLVKDQTLAYDNGIYVTGAGAWTRATDADTAAELGYAMCYVAAGTTNGGTSWINTIAGASITLATTLLVFARLPSANLVGVTTVANGGTGQSSPQAWPTTRRRMVRAVSIANIASLSAPGATLDGVTLVAGDRILLTAQSTASQNGIWQWNGAASALTRTLDYASGDTAMAYQDIEVLVREGTIYTGSVYRLSTTGTITIDSSSTAWSLVLAAPGAFSADMVYSVDTIAALKALTVYPTTVRVRGYYAAGDGGGGEFRWVAGSSTTDDGGLTIAPTVGSGRWKRVYAGMIETKWFGAKHDGTTDDSTACQAAVATGYDVRFSQGSIKLTSGLQITTRYQVVDMRSAKIISLGAPISIQAQNVMLDGPHYEGNYAAPNGIIVVGSATDSTKTSHLWVIRNPHITASAAKYAIVVANGSYLGDIEHPQITNGGGAVTSGSRGLFLGDQVQTVNVWGGAITGWEAALELRGNDGISLHQVDLGDGAVAGYYVYGNAIPAAADPSPFGTGVYPNGEGSWWGSPTQVIGNLTLMGCYTEGSDIALYFKTGLELKSLVMVGNLLGVNNSSPNAKVGTRIVKCDIPVSNLTSHGNWSSAVDYAFEFATTVNGCFTRDNWSDIGRGTAHVGAIETGAGAGRTHNVRIDGSGYMLDGYVHGRVIGDTGDKLGFFGLATPIVQPVGAAQAAFVDSTGGSASGSNTLAAITAPAANATTSLTADMTAVKNALATIAAAVNAHRLVLVNLGLEKGSA